MRLAASVGILVFTSALTTSAVAAPTTGKHKTKLPVLVKGLRHSVTWKPGRPDVELNLHFHDRVRPLTMRIGPDHPNGTILDVFFAKAAVNLMYVPKFNTHSGFKPFDDYGFLRDGYYIQVGEWKIAGSSDPQIVVAIGDGIVNVDVSVFRYHPVLNPKDAVRVENWDLTGDFHARKDATIDGDTITLPYGSVGLYSKYTWVKNKFVDTTKGKTGD